MHVDYSIKYKSGKSKQPADTLSSMLLPWSVPESSSKTDRIAHLNFTNLKEIFKIFVQFGKSFLYNESSTFKILKI